MFLPWLALLATHAAAADVKCDGIDLRRVAGLARGAIVAYAQLDPQGFLARREEALLLLPCFDRWVLPREAADLHAMEALVAFADRDEARMLAALAALWSVDPELTPLVGTLPPGHPLWSRLLDAQARTLDGLQPTRVPGHWVVDGRLADGPPAGRAAIVQQLGADGEVRGTEYRWPEAVEGPPSAEAPAEAPDAHAGAAATGDDETGMEPALAKAPATSAFAAQLRSGWMGAFGTSGFTLEAGAAWEPLRPLRVDVGVGVDYLRLVYTDQQRERIADTLDVPLEGVADADWVGLLPLRVGVAAITGEGEFGGVAALDATCVFLSSETAPAVGGGLRLGVEYRPATRVRVGLDGGGGLWFGEAFGLFNPDWQDIQGFAQLTASAALAL